VLSASPATPPGVLTQPAGPPGVFAAEAAEESA
jgi:hypothetical protein